MGKPLCQHVLPMSHANEGLTQCRPNQLPNQIPWHDRQNDVSSCWERSTHQLELNDCHHEAMFFAGAYCPLSMSIMVLQVHVLTIVTAAGCMTMSMRGMAHARGHSSQLTTSSMQWGPFPCYIHLLNPASRLLSAWLSKGVLEYQTNVSQVPDSANLKPCRPHAQSLGTQIWL